MLVDGTVLPLVEGAFAGAPGTGELAAGLWVCIMSVKVWSSPNMFSWGKKFETLS